MDDEQHRYKTDRSRESVAALSVCSLMLPPK